MKYILDTNICIYLIRKRPPEIEKKFSLFRKGEVGISSITWAELCCGITEEGAQHVENLLNVLDVLPFGIAEGIIYGKLTKMFPSRKANFDRMIAAHAISAGVILVTNNPDDFNIYQTSGLQIENWVQNGKSSTTA
ncbi:MAG: type II toxin-antitoxin system VapC family toxin [Desulfovibrio sp.]|nr:type II toxin-antitoxin system VapC family toxin [Desulfovibrio sp.]